MHTSNVLPQTERGENFPAKVFSQRLPRLSRVEAAVSAAKKARDLSSRPSYRLRILYIYFANIVAWILFFSLSATPSSRIAEVTLASFGRVVEMNSDRGGGATNERMTESRQR